LLAPLVRRLLQDLLGGLRPFALSIAWRWLFTMSGGGSFGLLSHTATPTNASANHTQLRDIASA